MVAARWSRSAGQHRWPCQFIDQKLPGAKLAPSQEARRLNRPSSLRSVQFRFRPHLIPATVEYLPHRWAPHTISSSSVSFFPIELYAKLVYLSCCRWMAPSHRIIMPIHHSAADSLLLDVPASSSRSKTPMSVCRWWEPHVPGLLFFLSISISCTRTLLGVQYCSFNAALLWPCMRKFQSQEHNCHFLLWCMPSWILSFVIHWDRRTDVKLSSPHRHRSTPATWRSSSLVSYSFVVNHRAISEVRSLNARLTPYLV
jgi:hypothetical protein